MLSNLSNNNSGNATKSVVEKKHYEDIEKRLDELQDEIDSNTESINQNAQDISGLDDRVGAVEDNSTFPNLNTDVINPATGDKVEVTSDLGVNGEVEAISVKTNALSVNGTNFETVKDDAAQAKSTAEIAENKANDAYSLADALSDELADYKSDNEQSITTGTLNAGSVIADSVAAQTINTNDFETTNAEIDKLYVDTIKATGFLELPTVGQSYYTVTIPAKTTASFSGVYTSTNNTDYPYYFTVSDGAVIYKQGSTEIIKDISFDRETGYTKVRFKSSTSVTYIGSSLDNNPITIEDGGDAYTDYAFVPQKTGGYLIRGYDDTTTEIYIAGVLRAYALSVGEEIIERMSVDSLKINNSIELPKEWDAGGTISHSTGEENEYISAQKKNGTIRPTWTSPVHSTTGTLSYSTKLVDEASVASYKGISETRQTQTVSITDEESLQQLTSFRWVKNGNYWQPYETTRITIGDQTMWIDPTESNQGIMFSNGQVIADGTWDDMPVEETNAVPVNLVIFDAPTVISYPITNLGDQTVVHGEITADCFKGNLLGDVTGNADTATTAAGTSTFNHYCVGGFTGNGDCPLALTDATDTSNTASLGPAVTCALTYNPSSGVLKRNGGEMAGYSLTLPTGAGGTRYALIDTTYYSSVVGDGGVIEGKIYNNTFTLVKSDGYDCIYRHSIQDYGDLGIGRIGGTTCVWIRYNGWRNLELFGQKPIKLVCTQTTAPDGITFNDSQSCVSCASVATTAESVMKVCNSFSAGNAGDLVYATMGDNDMFRIRVGGASDQGWAEIATADDGNEPIYVRQYTGVFTNVARTATLLDVYGNTSFPGQVYADRGFSTARGSWPANSNVAGFLMASYTEGFGYNGGAYIGHCNVNHDDWWGYATFGFYNRENDTLCPGMCIDRMGNAFFPSSVMVSNTKIVGYNSTSCCVPTVNVCDDCFQVYVDRSSLSVSNLNVVDVGPSRVGIGGRSYVGGNAVALGGYACSYCNSIAIGYGSRATRGMIAIGTYLHMCTGNSQSDCVHAVIMAPGDYDSVFPHLPPAAFGCARIMFKYGTPQCTMFSFLKCLFEGRNGNGTYAYASRIVQGDCNGCITNYDSNSYSLVRANSGNKFTFTGHWDICCCCTAAMGVDNTNGYASFDLVW